MTRLRDVVELKVIFNNISTWAASAFRNWVSDRVVEWRSRFPSTSSDEDEDEDIVSITTRVGKLKISRTNSLGIGNQLSVARTTTRETSQPHPLDVSQKAISIPEAKSQEVARSPITGDSDLTLNGNQEESNKRLKRGGSYSTTEATAASLAARLPFVASNKMVVRGGESAIENDADIKITINSLEGADESNILPALAPTPSRREEVAESPPDGLLTPRPSRPRGASTGSSISRDSNPASFRLLAEVHNPRTSNLGDTLQVNRPRAVRPRSFDAKEFEGVKFPFDISLGRAKDDAHLNMPQRHVRVFSAHDLDGEEFSFITTPLKG